MRRHLRENAHIGLNAPKPGAPYLSVVATARNDDHGGNLLGRMQVFVDGWIKQANRHQLSSELIIVEWNPPEGRPRLAEALRWPVDTGVCTVRIIEVPPEIHARYRHAKALPLYQMIAKNVGIRRALGEFVLATNIDIVFSDELIRFLATKPLVKGCMYRIDRYDVTSDVPVNGTLDEQLAYCRTHIIRLCAREGIFRLTPEGLRQTEPDDITPLDSGIHFGPGWFPTELYGLGNRSRWIENSAELFVRVPKGGGMLELEVEPGPGVRPHAERLQVFDRNGSRIANWTIAGRTTLRLLVPETADGGFQLLKLYVPGGGKPLLHDPRILNFQFLRCGWVAPKPPAPLDSYSETIRANRSTLARLLTTGGESLGLVSRVFGRIAKLKKAFALLAKSSGDIFGPSAECWGPNWYEPEHSPGARFRWVSGEAAVLVRATAPISSLVMLVEPGPGVGFGRFMLQVRSGDGAVVARVPVEGLTYLELPLSLPSGLNALFLSAEAGGAACDEDPRILDFRVFGLACHTTGSGDAPDPTIPVRPWAALSALPISPAIDWASTLRNDEHILEDLGRPQYLHLYACGDFTLLAREDWFDIRGYAELHQFSMHLDSILCYTAHHAGLSEVILPEPMRIYHIEHGAGSGWTPEGENEMYMRIARKGIETVSYDQLVALITQMRTIKAPVIFNMDAWGLSEYSLMETVPGVAPRADICPLIESSHVSTQ
uniref:Uncharacterized protein n=1 Tax=Solibacter usitatus (strain Ellin6076) TaxID=234267 RepID=Q02BB1_SOLUE